VSFRESKSLLVPNEVATIALLKASPELAAADFVRTHEALDREALEKLDDAALARLGVLRKATESFSLKPVKVDLAKVAAAEPGAESEVAA
jgi:phage host-nuclease inhibitor protein Gam